MHDTEELYSAGRLLQWGLHPRARSAAESEYRQLLDRYCDQFSFRDIVQAIADGLGLRIIDANARGMVLVPAEDSIFALTASDYRPSASSDERLLDGLIQVAIVATIYPRAQDLEEDSTIARPAITVEEVEATLRHICDLLEEAARGQPDPSVENLTAGLYEAWRVYRDRTSVKTTSGQRASPATTFRMIERALDFLQQQGCFMVTLRANRKSYRPTWRYQVTVQEWSAAHLYKVVRTLLDTKES